MNRVHITSRSFFMAGVFALVALSSLQTMQASTEREQNKDHVAAFFNCAETLLPSAVAALQSLESGQVLLDEELMAQLRMSIEADEDIVAQLRNAIKQLTILSCIAHRDVNALNAATVEDLTFVCDDCDDEFYFMVDGKQCKDTMNGRLVSFTFCPENALPAVLYHSILDETKEDKAATLAMLNVLFSKGLDTEAVGCCGYWLLNTKSDSNRDAGDNCSCDCDCDDSCSFTNDASDYVGEFSLAELAIIYSFPEAQELVVQCCQ